MEYVWSNTPVAKLKVGNQNGSVLVEYNPKTGSLNVSNIDSYIRNASTPHWGCMPETDNECIDMSNSASTYFGIAVGALVGAIISIIVYILQNKISIQQEENLKMIKELDEKHDIILNSLQKIQKHQDHILERIINLEMNKDKKTSELEK